MAALRGENSKVMARMRTGFAVIGDTQYLPGYSLLLIDDLSIDHLTDLPWPRRRDFLLDLSLLGEAVFAATREHGARRINYQVLGNSIHLHGHVHARYEWEPGDRIGGPVWQYPKELRNAPEHAYDDERHGALRAAITAELTRVMGEAYAAIGVSVRQSLLGGRVTLGAAPYRPSAYPGRASSYRGSPSSGIGSHDAA